MREPMQLNGKVSRGRTIAELNLIPLIDVALILVIIFMVLTPILVQSQLTVKLPKAESGTSASAENTVTVQISRNGALTVEGAVVKWPSLEKELTLRLPQSAKKTLLVQADRSVAVEKVVAVLDAAKRLGVGKLGIGVVSGNAE
ncbi:MAG: biopolymer transporter ExbD [Elusimicrobia bacterium]|nr:biopolymer transporter ExbD [Elusimicrobiota bacterium]